MLEIIRIPEEKTLCDNLRDWLAADTILQLMGQSGLSGATGTENQQLWPIGSSLPGLRKLLDEVVERLAMQDQGINFFLQADSSSLATSRIVINGGGEQVEIIFSARLLETLSPDEIRAVTAHELAHLFFGHTRLQLCIDWLDLAAKHGKLYALSNLYVYWRQLAELSADRASLLVVEDPGSALGLLARQKVEGLSRDMDMALFLREAQEAIDSRAIRPSRSSHPSLEIRALAMEHFRQSAFCQSVRAGKTVIIDDSLPAINSLTERLKISPANVKQFLELTFLLTAGNYLIQADNDIHNTEVRRLRDILARLLHAPQDNLCSPEALACAADLGRIGEAFAVASPSRCLDAFELLCSLVVQDGRIAPAEKEALSQIAAVLHIPGETMARIILKVLRQEFHPTASFGSEACCGE